MDNPGQRPTSRRTKQRAKRGLLLVLLGISLPPGGVMAQVPGSSPPPATDIPAAETPSGTRVDEPGQPAGTSRSPAGNGAQGPIGTDPRDQPMSDRERNIELRRDRELGPTATPDAGSSERREAPERDERSR